MGQMNHTPWQQYLLNNLHPMVDTEKRQGRGNRVTMRQSNSLSNRHRPVCIPSSVPLMAALLLLIFFCAGCRRSPGTVAVIPRTCGTALWEPEHAGAAAVGRSVGLNLYWNAPMRDDDTQTQISLIEEAVERGMAGIIVSPIQTLPELNSNTVRERNFESTLRSEFPEIRIVARRLGLSSMPQEQHSAEELLAGSQSLDAIVALSLAATRGTYYALAEFGKARTIKLVGFDQDLIPPIRDGGIDSVVVQNTFEMGRIAMQLINAEIHGAPGSRRISVEPVLMTRENVDSAEIRQIENMNWWSPQ